MAISVRCEKCGRQIAAKDSLASKTIQCPDCRSAVRVPNLQTETHSPTDTTLDKDKAEKSQSGKRPAAETHPKALADYEIAAELGRGGMGVVYKARQKSLKRIVALKMIKVQQGRQVSERALGRFYAEAEAVAKLVHPNIVQVYQIGEADGLPFYAMEFVGGGNLADRVGDEPQAMRDAAETVSLLASAMQYAHQRGVIHRDLKPANILLTEDGTLKITDFGLAKQLFGQTENFDEFVPETDALGAGPGLTVAGKTLGTPEYMAPEQAAGKANEAGTSADVYALGAILYKLLAGRPPFRAATLVETLRQVQEDTPELLSRLQPGISRDLEAICLKCLQKQTYERYASAQDLAEDLARFIKGEPVEARPVGSLQRLIKWAKRYPAIAGSLVVLALVLLAATVVSSLFAVEASRERKTAVEQAELAAKNAIAAETNAAKSEANAKELLSANEELEAEKKRADSQRDEAQRQAQLANERLASSQRGSYNVQLSRVNELRLHNQAEARNLLEDRQLCPPQLRDFAWGYLARSTRLQRLTFENSRNIRTLAFSPDGKTVAAVSSISQEPKLWDALTGQEKQTFKGHTFTVNILAFTNDGASLVSASDDATIRFWDVQTGKEVQKIDAGRTVKALALSPDGSTFAAVVDSGSDAKIKLWTIKGEERSVLDGNVGSAYSLAFAPDGKTLASGGGDNSVKLWSLDPRDAKSATSQANKKKNAATQSRSLKATLTGHTGRIGVVAFSPDGKLIASGGDDTTVKLWSAESGQERVSLQGHTRNITSLAFAPDGHSLATADGDQIKIWDLESHQQKLTLAGKDCVAFSPDGSSLVSGGDEMTLWDWQQEPLAFLHKGRVNTLAISPNGETVASADSSGSIVLRDLQNGTEIRTIAGAHRDIVSMAFSPDGKTLASTSYSTSEKPEIELWAVETGTKRATLKGHADVVTFVTYSADGKTLATGSRDKTVRLWNPETGDERATLTEHDDEISTIAFSPDGKSLATSDFFHTIILRDGETAKPRIKIDVTGRGGCRFLTFSPDGNVLATAAMPNLLKLYDVDTGKERLTFIGHSGAVSCVSFSTDGRTLASSSADGTVKLWDPETGHQRLTLTGHSGPVGPVAFLPDGVTLASSGNDKTIRLWRAEQNFERYALRGHSEKINSVAFSPDGKVLASGSEDKTIKFWDSQTGRELSTLMGHSEGVEFVAFSPRASTLVSADRRGMKLWNLQTGEEFADLEMRCRAFGRSFDNRTFAYGVDGAIFLYDLEALKVRSKLETQQHEIKALAFSRDMKRIASANTEWGNLSTWDLATGRMQAKATDNSREFDFVALSSSGKVLVAGNWQDKAVKLWNPETCQQVGTLGLDDSRYGSIDSLAFSPDEDILAVASEHDAIRLWNVETRQLLATLALERDAKEIRAMAFSPDGMMLASAVDNEIRLWDVGTALRSLTKTSVQP